MEEIIAEKNKSFGIVLIFTIALCLLILIMLFFLKENSTLTFTTLIYIPFMLYFLSRIIDYYKQPNVLLTRKNNVFTFYRNNESKDIAYDEIIDVRLGKYRNAFYRIIIETKTMGEIRIDYLKNPDNVKSKILLSLRK